MNIHANFAVGIAAQQQLGGCGCGVPVDCCCYAGNFDFKQDEMSNSFIDFRPALSKLKVNTDFVLIELLRFEIIDITNTVLASIPAAAVPPSTLSLTNLAVITAATPLTLTGNPFLLEEVKTFYEDKFKGIRIRHRTPVNSPLNTHYQIRYKAKFASKCENGLIYEIADCANVRIIKC